MSVVKEPEALVRALAEERIPSEDPETLALRRERLVPNLARHVRAASAERDRRAQRVRIGIGVAAAASVALALGVGYRLHRGAPVATRGPNEGVASLRQMKGTLVVTHAGRAHVVAPSEPLDLLGGDELRTAADGSAMLQTERSAIQVEPATQLSVLARSPLEERIHLSLGKVELKVSKVPQSNRSVVVETPNAEVVVHGTMFSVTVGSEYDTPVTRVRVTEGSVWILHGGKRELINVGSEWTSLARAAESAPAAVPPAPALSAPAPAAPARGPSASLPAARGSSGSLGEENRMFQAALDARNHGEEARAVELFGALLARYPNGRLAEEARVERMRGLRRTGNVSGAASEARRYLAEHPHGYAQDEARGDALNK